MGDGFDFPKVCVKDGPNNTCAEWVDMLTDMGLQYTNATKFRHALPNQMTFKPYYSISKRGKSKKLIHKGDVAISNGHIAIVHSEKWGISKYKISLGTKYDIIHAYGGGDDSTYDERIPRKRALFARKVMVTGSNAYKSLGNFGRIILWE